MIWKRFLQRTLALLLIGICSISLLQPAVASAASTTQKSATVKFTKLKINGYTDISYFSSIGEYIVVFGKKKNGHIMSYSKDGKTFKDLNLDKDVN